MTKICICAHFANGIESLNGQTIKTKNIYNQLVKKFGINSVSIIDTYNWKRRPIKLFLQCISAAKHSENIIILPAHKGFKIFIPLFNRLKMKKNFKLHYVVIGGWIYSMIKDNKYMQKELSKVDFIYLENNKTITQLHNIGLKNLYQMNNFKDLSVSTYERRKQIKEIKCCIFSRIEEKKGISNAINVVKRINSDGNNKIKLDIYGPISEDYKNIFEKLLKGEKNIKYIGQIESTRSVETIEKYDLLLFPTLYYTEGIPGTIIDSFFSGVPVFASKWENYDEIMEENVTGFSYKFNDDEDFYNKFNNIIQNKEKLIELRRNCIKKAMDYTSEKSMIVLIKNIGD